LRTFYKNGDRSISNCVVGVRRAWGETFEMKLLSQIVVILVTTGFSVDAVSAPELNEQTVDLGNDVSLRVIEAGDPTSGATLVFIPGWSTTADIWREQINRFAATYRVISFDPRSQGRSTITTTGNTPETRAQDLHKLLEQLSARRPVLIGWSQGVEDIAAYINQYGTGDLSGIVLVDCALSSGAKSIAGGGAPARAAIFETFAVYQADQKKYLAGFMRAIVSKPQSNDAIEEWVTTGLKTPPDIGVAMRIADSFGVDRTPALNKINCPTLSIASAKSGSQASQQAQAKQISGARFEKVEDAAHAVFLDQPDRFDQLLESFVASLTTTPSVFPIKIGPDSWAQENPVRRWHPQTDEVVVPEPLERYSVTQAVTNAEKKASQRTRHVARPRPNLFKKLVAGFIKLQKQPPKSIRKL
jgi:non-heme chloroperoxidase